MSAKRRELRVGSRLAFEGSDWLVVGLGAGTVRLRNQARELAVLTHAEVFNAPDFEVIESVSASDPATPVALLDQVASASALTSADRRKVTVSLLITGFPEGVPDGTCGDPELGPQSGDTLEKRVARAAKKESVSPRTIKNWLRQYRDHGAGALIDARQLSLVRPLGRCHRDLQDLIMSVIDSYTGESKVTDSVLCKRVLHAIPDDADYPVPSERTLRKYIKELRRGRGHHLSTSTKRSIGKQPGYTQRTYVASRPFELVEIDTTPLDVFAICSETGEVVSPQLTIAIDVYTRSIVAWRFSAGDPSTEDSVLLLHDMIAPKPMREGWDRKAAWRYGIPQNLVISTASEDFCGVELAGIPSGKATTISADNGAIYTARLFAEACVLLGINLAYARPGRPTDKPHVERAFRTISEMFLQHLDGYKASSVAGRGSKEHVEDKANLFIWEIEDLFGEWVATYYQNRAHESLVFPGAERFPMSPNEMYDCSMLTAGYLPVPVDKELAIRLLRPVWRVVTPQGVDIDYVRYDSHELSAFRGKRSPFAEDKERRWPIRVDRRDLSRIWFWKGSFSNPTDGEWIEVPAIVAGGKRPFAATELDYVKSRLVKPGVAKTRHQRKVAIERELEDYLSRRDGGRLLDKREGRVARTGHARSAMAQTDNIGKKGRGEVSAKTSAHAPTVQPVPPSERTRVAELLAAATEDIRSIETYDVGEFNDGQANAS